MAYDKLIFELSSSDRVAYKLPKLDVDASYLATIPSELQKQTETVLPEVSEVDVIRHYTNLSMLNYGLDAGFYPLGSCTMKYNPKINENMAALNGFKNLHPYQPVEQVQGALALMYELQEMLAEIAGLETMTLQPAAGAHGEFTGLLIIKAYHEKRGDFKRTKIIVPDSAHGTNPSSAFVAGLEIVEIASKKDGTIDLEALKAVLSDEVAGFMLTNPSTLGLFESNIKEVADLVHAAGGLLYYDGANMNAVMGKARPGDTGFDVLHYNLHKTFSTPHGGGGPGAGPVGVRKDLVPFLPVPIIEKTAEGNYILNYDKPDSIGKIKGFYGNFGMLVRAYTYIKTMGAEGLTRASEVAVLNANYLMASLKDHYYLPIDKICKHEFVLGGISKDLATVSTLDIAKRMLDYHIHPPTVYFPLIIKEAIMIEPTETESLETLDNFIDIMLKIKQEAAEKPELLRTAPHDTAVGRIDEVKAAKDMILKWQQ